MFIDISKVTLLIILLAHDNTITQLTTNSHQKIFIKNNKSNYKKNCPLHENELEEEFIILYQRKKHRKKRTNIIAKLYTS